MLVSGVLATVVMSLLASPAHAQSREDGAPAESLGVADNVRASAWGPSAIYANPAALLRVPIMAIEAAYSYLDGKDGHNFGLSILDAKTNPDVALGVAYNYFSTAPEGVDRDGSQVRLALSTGYKADNVNLYAGIGIRWLQLTIGENDSEKGSTETNDVDTWTADIGLLLEFDHKIRFAVVGQNVIDTKVSEAPRIIGLGLSFLFGMLDVGMNLDLDMSNDTDRTVATWGAGADLVILDAVHLRTGFVRDEANDAERMTFGIGWSSDQVAVDIGYATALSDPTAMTLGVSLRWVP